MTAGRDIVPLGGLRRLTARRVAAGCGALALLSIAGFFGFMAWYHQNSRYHHRLRINMTRADVERVFGRSPDCETRIGGATVAYFLDPAWESNRDACAGIGPTYAAPEQLPWIYSSVQVAFGRDNRVSAFAHVGESSATSRGKDKSAGSLRSIPLVWLGIDDGFEAA
jgi:hypothetical protein